MKLKSKKVQSTTDGLGRDELPFHQVIAKAPAQQWRQGSLGWGRNSSYGVHGRSCCISACWWGPGGGAGRSLCGQSLIKGAGKSSSAEKIHGMVATWLEVTSARMTTAHGPRGTLSTSTST
jgi:hypothetical protein